MLRSDPRGVEQRRRPRVHALFDGGLSASKFSFEMTLPSLSSDESLPVVEDDVRKLWGHRPHVDEIDIDGDCRFECAEKVEIHLVVSVVTRTIRIEFDGDVNVTAGRRRTISHLRPEYDCKRERELLKRSPGAGFGTRFATATRTRRYQSGS